MSKRRLPVISNGGAGSAPARPIGVDDPSADTPALHEAVLDDDGVDCVLADLDDFAENLEVYAKSADGGTEQLADIVHARDGFRRGRFVGLQLMYRFADRLWVDTLLRADGGARLVRMPRQ